MNRAILLGILALGPLLYACAKSPQASVRGDAAHPTPVHLYTVAEETAKRRVQAVGSLFALEESILSSQVEGRVSQVRKSRPCSARRRTCSTRTTSTVAPSKCSRTT